MDVWVQAIRQRRLLAFSYDGLPREVVPAVYGRTRTGNTVLRAYQVGGATRSTTDTPWRMFTVAKAVDVQLLDEEFAADPPGYTRRDDAFSRITAQL